MKVGIVYPQPEIKGEITAVSQIAKTVEDRGFDHLLVYDHVLGAEHADRAVPLSGPYSEKDAFTDPLVMFAYLAGITERIQLMSGVLILPQRQTPLVARQAADIDLLSDGSLILGVGIGWNDIECGAMGFDFKTRGVRCGEQIELLKRFWTGETISYDGRFEGAERVRLNPAPKRSIPVWIGGFAPPAVDRAGKLADGFIEAGPVEVAIDVMRGVDAAREKYGRMDQPFGHTFVTLMCGNEEEAVVAAEKWREAGGTHVSITTMGWGLGSEVNAHLDAIGQIADRMGV